MSKLRNKTQGFTIVPQAITKDSRLDLRDNGLLLKLLSLPDDWDFSEKGLQLIIKDGLTSIRTGLKHLEQYGYLKRYQIRNEKGQFIDWEWEIFSEPQEIEEEKREECVNSGNEHESRNAEIPVIGKFKIGKSQTGNQTQLNTNKVNTKELNTKKNIYDENFEKLWEMLPPRPGDRKDKVSKERKKELYDMGIDKIKKTIETYLQKIEPKYHYNRDNFFNHAIDYFLYCPDAADIGDYSSLTSYDIDEFEKHKFEIF